MKYLIIDKGYTQLMNQYTTYYRTQIDYVPQIMCTISRWSSAHLYKFPWKLFEYLLKKFTVYIVWDHYNIINLAEDETLHTKQVAKCIKQLFESHIENSQNIYLQRQRIVWISCAFYVPKFLDLIEFQNYMYLYQNLEMLYIRIHFSG